MIKHHLGFEYYMEKRLYDNLVLLPKRIEKDKDVVGVIVGPPGTGKSTIAQQILYFLDNTITCKNIKYSSEDFMSTQIDWFHKNKSKGRGLIHDEGKESLSAQSVTSKKTRNFMKFLYENRQTNMYNIILTGDFFDLPRSIAMQRVLFMIWVKEEREFDNGFFRFYNRPDLRRLYLVGKKFRDMNSSGYTFRGSFPKKYCVDEEEYRKLKKAHLTKDRYIDQKSSKLKMTDRDFVEYVCLKNPDHKPADCYNLIEMTLQAYYKYKREYAEKLEYEGNLVLADKLKPKGPQGAWNKKENRDD